MPITLFELLGTVSQVQGEASLGLLNSCPHSVIPQVCSEFLDSSEFTSLESEMQALKANDAATPNEAAIAALALLESFSLLRRIFFSIFMNKFLFTLILIPRIT